jgi:hypothetical protein
MRDYYRYVGGFVATIIVIIILILGYNMLRKVAVQTTDNTPNNSESNTKSNSLTSADYKNQPVTYTVRGSITGNEEHNSIRITVSPSVRRVEVMQGYSNTVIKTSDTPNTQAAYDAFISALQGAKFTTVRKSTQVREQTCPLGKQYVYQVAPDNVDPFLSWATSCGRKQGTFNGNGSTIQELFRKQIPNYGEFTRGVDLN